MNFSKQKYFIFAIVFCFFLSIVKVVFAYDVIPPQEGGELTGTISFKGQVPAFKPLKVNRNTEFCGDTVPDESLIVNSENKGIQNVVISFEEVHQGKKHDPIDISIDNSKCHFVPRTVAAVIGDFYQIRNACLLYTSDAADE